MRARPSPDALFILAWCTAALIFLPMMDALAQEAPAAGELTITDVDTASHPQVSATVSGPIRGDDLPAIRLEEAGAEAPATITPADTRALEVILLIDTSGSMAGASQLAARAAGERFLRTMPPGVTVAAIGFGTEPTVLAPPSTDPGPAIAAMQTLPARGETALYDAVRTAVGTFSASAASHRAVVVLSDGGDTVSTATLDEAAAALAGSGATLHAVALDTAESDLAALERLAVVSGGTITSAVATDALDGVYATIASQLIHRYDVTWTSEGSGTTRVRITLTSGDERFVGEHDVTLPVAPAPAAPVPLPDALPDPGPLAASSWATSRWPLVTGVLGIYGFLALLVMSVLGPSRADPGASLRSWRDRREQHAPRRQTTLTEIAAHASIAVERGMERHGWSRTLNLALERAGIALRPGEFAVLVGSTAATAFVIGTLVFGRFVGVFLLVATILVAKVALGVLAGRRTAAFAEQLPDVLQLLAGSLRAGYGLMQALDSVAKEAPEPANEEFHRIIVESRLGRDLESAFDAMTERVDSEDWLWVVQAIEINREVGGDLAMVLDNVGQTIREREQLRRQIKALSAEGRLSAAILLGLPFLVAGMMWLKDPSYILELFNSGSIGLALLFTGGFLMIVGALWIKRVVRLVF